MFDFRQVRITGFLHRKIPLGPAAVLQGAWGTYRALGSAKWAAWRGFLGEAWHHEELEDLTNPVTWKTYKCCISLTKAGELAMQPRYAEKKMKRPHHDSYCSWWIPIKKHWWIHGMFTILTGLAGFGLVSACLSILNLHGPLWCRQIFTSFQSFLWLLRSNPGTRPPGLVFVMRFSTLENGEFSQLRRDFLYRKMWSWSNIHLNIFKVHAAQNPWQKLKGGLKITHVV